MQNRPVKIRQMIAELRRWCMKMVEN